MTQYYTATSIDGFIADQHNSLDWLDECADGADPSGRYDRFIADVGAVVMGSTTYEWIRRQLLHPVDAEPGSWPYVQPCWVFSSRDQPGFPGADIRFVRGPVAPVHAEMIQVTDQRPDGGRNIWICGGGDLVGQFFDAGLLDEIVLSIAPVFLGSGAPLLPRRIGASMLTLVEAEAENGVFAELTYRVEPVERG